jgi:hypothetical protein
MVGVHSTFYGHGFGGLLEDVQGVSLFCHPQRGGKKPT